MNKRIEVILAIMGCCIAGAVLLFGDNLYEQIMGHSVFNSSDPRTEPSSPDIENMKATLTPPANSTVQIILSTANAFATQEFLVSGTPVAMVKGFPVPSDASEITDGRNGGINFHSNMSLNDAVDFYRRTFSSQGLTEYQGYTNITEEAFSLVFDNHPSGKSVVVQGANLGNGVINISVRLESL